MGEGDAVVEGLAGTEVVGDGVGLGAGATSKTTAIWAGASVPVGSVKLIAPT